MVRRGSTVRVRQRALQKRRTSALFRSERVAPRRTCTGYGALYGAFKLKKANTARRNRPCRAYRTRAARATARPLDRPNVRVAPDNRRGRLSPPPPQVAPIRAYAHGAACTCTEPLLRSAPTDVRKAVSVGKTWANVLT